VLDTFDNSVSRRLVQDTCRRLGLSCLHVGLNADYAEVLWDDGYRVPSNVGADVCDYPLARNLVLLAVAVASEVVVRFVVEGKRENWTVTLKDFAVRPG
jgi:molybdopterin-synthase adenylyltransferase